MIISGFFRFISTRSLPILASFFLASGATAQASPPYNICVEPIDGNPSGPIDNIFALKSGVTLADIGGNMENKTWLLFDQQQNKVSAAGTTPPNFLTDHGTLPDGNALIEGDYGLLMFNAKTGQVAAAPGSSVIGSYSEILPVPDGSYLIHIHNNFFRFDVSNNIVKPLREPSELNDVFDLVQETLALPGKSLLLVTNDGLAVFKPASDYLSLVGEENLGAIKTVGKLGNGRLLVATSHAGWFVFDPTNISLQSAGPGNYGTVPNYFDFEELSSHLFADGDVLLDDHEGLSLFHHDSEQVKPVAGGERMNVPIIVAIETPNRKTLLIDDKIYSLDKANDRLARLGNQSYGFVFDAYNVSKNIVFLNTDHGLFLLDADDGKTLQAVPLKGFGVVEKLNDGSLLVIRGNGDWWRVDPTTASIDSAGQTAAFDNYDQAIVDGGVLVMSPEGEYFYDPKTKLVQRAGDAAVGHIYVRRPLPNGGLLIGAANGLFVFDPVLKEMRPASSEVMIGTATSGADLSNGDFLFGTNVGLVRVWPKAAARPCPATTNKKSSGWW